MLKSAKKEEWFNAMSEEIKVMEERKVWELVKQPKDVYPLGCRWVYTLKT